jgi:hypothetical protein
VGEQSRVWFNSSKPYTQWVQVLAVQSGNEAESAYGKIILRKKSASSMDMND